MTNIKTYKEWLFVEVPEGTADVSQVHIYAGEDPFCFHDKDGAIISSISIPGSYSIVGMAGGLTEEQWMDIVTTCYVWVHNDGEELFYKDYTDIQQIISSDYSLETAEESGHSLVKSLGLEVKTTLIIHLNSK